MARPTAADPAQGAFDDLDVSLRDVTFVVVDLETTGGSPVRDAITEIGAVKVRGGEVLGEFATLVDPGRPVPPQIVALTGITDAMVYDAPRIESVLPAYLEFARGAVWVAHNARFDMGFLKAHCRDLDIAWPRPAVVDTVALARSVLTRDEAPSVKLSVLARLLGATTQPDHRALHDARATVDVLHALLERLGPLGVQTLPDLQRAHKKVDPQRRGKRHLAEHLPHRPGVYLFRGQNDEVLYVGTATNLRVRVMSYFTASESRAKMRDMLRLATRIDHVECSIPLEANIREQRLIATHQPPYNRRSRTPHKNYWVRLSDEAFPRLVVSRTPPSRATPQLGPFSSFARARQAAEAVQSAVPLRSCTQRIPRSPHGSPCALYELGACGAPCAGLESPRSYAVHVQVAQSLLSGATDAPLQSLRNQLSRLAQSGQFAQAARIRDRIEALVRGLVQRQQLGAFADIAELVAAQPHHDGGWAIVLIRYGRLVAAGLAGRGTDPWHTVASLRLSAETVVPRDACLPAASPEEARTLVRWLLTDGTRLVDSTHGWAEPARGAGSWTAFADAAGTARAEYDRTVREWPSPVARSAVASSRRRGSTLAGVD